MLKIHTYNGNSLHIRINRELDLLIKGKGHVKHYHISEITPKVVGDYDEYVRLMEIVDDAQYSLYSSRS